MRIYLCLFLWTVIKPVAYQQQGINTALQKNILTMFKADQKWRIESNKINNGKKSGYSEDAINRNMEITDSLNMISAKSIIDRYGFPGYDLVGEDGSGAFWAIIQHGDDDTAFQQRVLKLMAAQVAKHNANAQNYALLQDRVLVNTHHKQIYGTQITFDAKTHQPNPSLLPMPNM